MAIDHFVREVIKKLVDQHGELIYQYACEDLPSTIEEVFTALEE